MTFPVQTPQPTRQDFAQICGNNQRLLRFFESLAADVRSTLPDAIISVQDISTAPFIVQSASSLVPNAYVLQNGTGLTKATATGTVTIGLAVPVPVALGGTGGTTPATARANLGAASSGANSDITSLTGLTTPLAISEGGTGASTAAAALANLGGVTAAQAAAAAPVQSVFGRTGNVTAQTGDYSYTQVTGAVNAAGAAAAAPVQSVFGRTGAVVATSGDYSVGQVTGAAPLSNPVFAVGIGLATGAAAAALALNANAGQIRETVLYTASSVRWAYGADGSAESGSNAGSNFFINRYSDAGALLDQPLVVNRASGVATFSQSVVAPLFQSAFTTTSVPTATATTVYTFANTTPEVWMVSANIGQVNDATHYGVVAVIYTDGTTARVALSNTGTSMAVAMSGLNLQITQSSGATQTIKTTLTRLG